MSSERIFNIFVFFEKGTATEYGVRFYTRSGSAAEKETFLASVAPTGFAVVRRFPLPRSFTEGEWRAAQRLGLDIGLFEEGLFHFRAPREPMLCISSIVDGALRADEQVDLGAYLGAKVGKELPGEMHDWLEKYTEGGAFRLDKLINDDFFVAIRLLFNANHLASAAKLLMSCIDTMAYIEFGDAPRNFIEWLKKYVDLAPLWVTAEEVWEFRNSLVHMTSISSRAVLAGKVAPISPYIGDDTLAAKARTTQFKPFNLQKLIIAVGQGVRSWGSSYNTDRDKFLKFVERYDTVVSDSRMAVFSADSVRITSSV